MVDSLKHIARHPVTGPLFFATSTLFVLTVIIIFSGGIFGAPGEVEAADPPPCTVQVNGNTATINTVGTCGYTVPSYTSSLTVEVWGGGGGGKGTGGGGGNGGQSSFQVGLGNALSAYGGTGGTCADPLCNTGAGAGGTASGGDTNVSGNPGALAAHPVGGAGGGSPNGGAGGAGGVFGQTSATYGSSGTVPGGGGGGNGSGGSGMKAGHGGGGGGYASKTYTSGQLVPGTSKTVTVGSGGAHGAAFGGTYLGGEGAAGRVVVTWTDASADCTFNGNPVSHGSSVTAYQSATVPDGSSCVSESRTCTDGTLSGSYQHATCTVANPPPSGDAITGYAWSETIGWISLNGPTYGWYIADGGELAGYAWSENIGWVSTYSSDLTGCPQSPCTARIENGNLFGWARALAGGTAESAGWDGFIALGDTNVGDGINYGVSLGTDGEFRGFAWGDVNVGWLSFNCEGDNSCGDVEYLVETTYQDVGQCFDTQGYFCDGNTSMHRDQYCAETVEQVCTSYCAPDIGLCVPTPSPTGNLEVNPEFVIPGDTTLVTWDIADAVSCEVTEDNPDINDVWTGSSGSHTSSPIGKATTYTLVCEGQEGTMLTQEATVSIAPGWREL